MKKKSWKPPVTSDHITIHRLHEQRTRRWRLGRQIVHDPRSRNFPAKQATKIVSVMHAYADALPLDQGRVGSCTANAALAAMLCDPFRATDKLATTVTQFEKFALGLYHDETELHPRDGVYPPADPGGCGLWIAKVLKNRGLITSYSHAFGLDHALKAIVKAPCIVGIDWYSSFDTPDPAGAVTIAPRARVEGGHEVCAIGIDAEKNLVWLINSWGKWGFGKTGKFSMSFDTFDTLLKNQGDCTQFAV